MKTNQPYVKRFDAQGVLLNPIVGSYESKLPNRSLRKLLLKAPRFINNKNHYPITINTEVTPPIAYVRKLQIAPIKEFKNDEGEVVSKDKSTYAVLIGWKKIKHYITK